MGTIYDQFIATCWDNYAHKGLPRNHIIVSEVPKLVTEMEAFLGVLTLLTKPEMEIILKMALDKPTLKLFQRDVERFILRLTKTLSMEELLQKRANTLKLTLTRLLDNHTTYSFRPKSLDDTFSLRGKYERNKIPEIRPYSEPKSLVVKEEPIKLEPTIPIPTGGSAQSDISDVEELQRKVAHLERLCLLYEEKLGKTGPERLDSFKKALDEQDKLIRDLQLQRNAKVDWLHSLPFAKQYFYSGKRQFPGVVVDVIALFLAFLIIQNLLKLIYYTTLWSVSSHISFSWIQQVPWLEYWVYSFNEWLES